MSRFPTLDALRAACHHLPAPDEEASAAIRAREAQLAKPNGSLGRLETLTQWFGSWRALRIDHAVILVFAGNHGVVSQGVTLWPQSITRAMVKAFSAGGAAINQLARIADAELRVIPVGDLQPTRSITKAPAMTEAAFLSAVTCGYEAVPQKCDFLALGEMGVGNTTAASALTAALFGEDGACWAGRGAGLDSAGLRHKARVIDAALALQGTDHDPFECARRYGGYELAALLGAALAARHRRIPVMLDGFVVTAAVTPLARFTAYGLAHARVAHCSSEHGHSRLCTLLGLEPLFDLGLRLGEASGAALAIPLARAALACHIGMASLSDLHADDPPLRSRPHKKRTVKKEP